MIRSHDRSGWFGASDSAMIMGNWNTPTFAKWWAVKLGIRQDHFTSLAMQTGTALEHRILEHLCVPKWDRQIKVRRLRLRVNLDGEAWDTQAPQEAARHVAQPIARRGSAATATAMLYDFQTDFRAKHGYIVEVKTHSAAVFRVSKPYWQQAQVEMFAAKKSCRIAAYRVTGDDYRNWFLPIDPARISLHPIEYDQPWIETQYLPRLRYLAGCLRKGAWPDAAAI